MAYMHQVRGVSSGQLVEESNKICSSRELISVR